MRNEHSHGFARPDSWSAISCKGTDMGEIIKFKKPSLKEKAEGKTLCKSGFHRWKVVTERKFDVKQGKLVTRRRCERCGKEQTILR
jgi:hypothetical protein